MLGSRAKTKQLSQIKAGQEQTKQLQMEQSLTRQVLVVFVVLLLAVTVSHAQSTAATDTNQLSEKQRKEADKKAKEEAKAKERAEKEAQKQRAKEEKQQRAAHLASVPTLTIAAKPEVVGQVLTTQLNSAGFTLAEYQPPQQVFGANTPYRAVYTKPISDVNTGVNMRVWIYLTYGIPTAGQGDMAYYMNFEIADTPQGSVLTARYGLAAQTTRGAVARDMTSVENFRRELDDLLERLKTASEKIATILKPPSAAEAEMQFWEVVQNTNSLLDINSYLEKYPAGKFADVMRQRAESISKRPETPIAKKHGDRAADLTRASQWEEAESEWRDAVTLEPNSLLLLANLADLLTKRNKWAEAETALRRAIELDPNNPRWHGDLGLTLMRQNKWTEAETAYSKAVQLEPAKQLWQDMLQKAKNHEQP
jgi:tetratricopeptide (TPR) repeat protein